VIELIHLICSPFLFLMRMGDEIPSTRPAEILSRFSSRAILSMSAVRNGSGAPEQLPNIEGPKTTQTEPELFRRVLRRGGVLQARDSRP
jgi:hypothetical protein